MTVEIAAAFLDHQLAAWTRSKPLVVGISGPQGSGKSYLATHLLHHLNTKHPKLTSVGVSVDDFYLTHSEQAKVSADAKKSGNFVLEGRGLPGTHDLSLAFNTMDALVSGKPAKVPRYDKSAFNGEGDRTPEQNWQVVAEPVNVIVFEGWFNGYRAIDQTVFPSVYLSNDPSGPVHRSSMAHLEEINTNLQKYEKLWDMFDCSVILRAVDLDYVYKWRLQQESELISRKGQGMKEADVISFVNRYMPIYDLYYWRMCDQGISKKGTNLCLSLDFDRNVTQQKMI
ncbi:hypothetical protein JCM33374_g1773 [Metschnikowia sp. JCM 33374]|nr:hypothetical protein JCM33374_g1773 [Metschnikowia sp. JCM 33374]